MALADPLSGSRNTLLALEATAPRWSTKVSTELVATLSTSCQPVGTVSERAGEPVVRMEREQTVPRPYLGRDDEAVHPGLLGDRGGGPKADR